VHSAVFLAVSGSSLRSGPAEGRAHEQGGQIRHGHPVVTHGPEEMHAAIVEIAVGHNVIIYDPQVPEVICPPDRTASSPWQITHDRSAD
jgi:hypothetical protein